MSDCERDHRLDALTYVLAQQSSEGYRYESWEDYTEKRLARERGHFPVESKPKLEDIIGSFMYLSQDDKTKIREQEMLGCSCEHTQRGYLELASQILGRPIMDTDIREVGKIPELAAPYTPQWNVAKRYDISDDTETEVLRVWRNDELVYDKRTPDPTRDYVQHEFGLLSILDESHARYSVLRIECMLREAFGYIDNFPTGEHANEALKRIGDLRHGLARISQRYPNLAYLCGKAWTTAAVHNIPPDIAKQIIEAPMPSPEEIANNAKLMGYDGNILGMDDYGGFGWGGWPGFIPTPPTEKAEDKKPEPDSDEAIKEKYKDVDFGQITRSIAGKS